MGDASQMNLHLKNKTILKMYLNKKIPFCLTQKVVNANNLMFEEKLFMTFFTQMYLTNYTKFVFEFTELFYEEQLFLAFTQ